MYFARVSQSEILKKIKHTASTAELYYLRTQDKSEIDLIVDYKQRADFIEIKKSQTYTTRMSTALRSYAREQDRKIVLYQGQSLKQSNVDVLNYGDYLS